ncbi:MAG TPA: hypothetical protein V6C52_03065 [Coleofasciculaceae cyanobacterium]
MLLSAESSGLSLSGRNREHLPPNTSVSPTMLNPSPNGSLDALPESQTGPVQPQSDVGGPSSPDPLPALVKQGIFPADAITRNTPVTRAELAGVLVKALKHNTEQFSEFPFYRDVPRESPVYIPVEVAREKRLMTEADDQGFYFPERAVTYGEVYTAISNAITGPPPSPEEAAHLLSRFTDRSELPPEMRQAVAKMARTRSFWRSNQGDISSLWQDTVTPEGLAPLIASLMYLTENRADLLPEDVAIPVLPANLELSVSPSSAIFESRISVGETLYFSLVFPVDPLPKGTRLQGIVRAVQPDKTYVIELTDARTPEDVLYSTSAELTITFPKRERLAFVVPGEVFKATTRIPANAPQSTIPVQPTTGPPGSSANRAGPPSAPPPR